MLLRMERAQLPSRTDPRMLRSVPSLPFILRYPPGHEKSGQMVERISTCPDCGESFRQRQVNHDWIAGSHVDFQTDFLGTVEVNEGGVHLPPTCNECQRVARLRAIGRDVSRPGTTTP